MGGNRVVYADPPDAVNIADRMFEVLNWDKKKRDRWVQHAKIWAGTFSWNTTAIETVKVLRTASREHYPD